MTETKVWSLDDGFGDFKFDKLGEPGLIPSFITEFQKKPERALDDGIQKQPKYLASRIGDRDWLVGEFAQRLDENIDWIGGENKHSDLRFPALLKTILGNMCSGSDETVDVLMMNLPIKQDTPEKRKELIDMVEGTHEVSISTDGQNFVRKIVTVEKVIVKKQAFGSVCALMLDGHGEIENKELAKGFNVVVDIGARTVNFLTLDALEEKPELTFQTNNGMFQAYTHVGSILENELGVPLPDGKLPLIIQKGEHKGNDITGAIDFAYANHANRIISILEKRFINSWGFVQNVIFTGGGSELMKKHIINSFKRPVNTVFLDRFANVRGLRQFGLRWANKNIKRSKGISATIGSQRF